MGMGVEETLRLKRGAGRPLPLDQSAKPRRRVGVNAPIGLGLWVLLWLGYNADYVRLMRPGFPADTMDFIHGVRAFSPMLAGWISLLLIFARSRRLFAWIMGPLGLMLLYAVTGLASSATVSINPTDALYYGANYLAIVLVVLAIVLVEDPLPDLRMVLRLTWGVSTILTFALLGAIPMLRSTAVAAGDETQIGVSTYTGAGVIMGMPSTRNTGFARYAAISALVALPGLMRKGRPVVRIIWGIVFAVSVYALYVANGRTEILAFVGSAALIFAAEKAKRFVYFLAATGAAILLGLRGFYSGFFRYFTRTGHLDLTMSGRTRTWEEAWPLFWKSPWVGSGFQADRFYMSNHMHNAFLHVMVQSGLLGGGAILIGLAIVWYYLIKHFFLRRPADRSLVPPEIPAVFLFVTISSVTESTFAYFSAAWLLSAPIVAYVISLHRQIRQSSAAATREKWQKAQFGRRRIRDSAANDGMRPSRNGGPILP
jgi:O-antigen ligase